MKVLVADKLSESFASLLEDAGLVVDLDASLQKETLTERLATTQPSVLVVRSTKVSKEHLEASKNLELVVRAGAGYDNVDLESASALGIFVANCPAKNSTAVAELTMGLVLSIDRSIPDNVIDARHGTWNKAKYSKADGLKGRTLGLIGMGSIGSEVARLAQSFGMDVCAWSRSLTEKKAAQLGISYCKTPLDVARQADIVSVHVAGSADTKGMVNADFFASMKPGACLVNTSRSSVVDEAAMVAAIDSKGIRVGLDVFEGEPSGKDGSFDSPLARNSGVYITHHIGASTDQAQTAIAEEAARVVNEYAMTGDVPNCVNLATTSPATYQLTVRHLDRVGVLAAVLDEMRRAEWNVQEMENLVFENAQAACARIRFDGVVTDSTVETIGNIPHVLASTLIEL